MDEADIDQGSASVIKGAAMPSMLPERWLQTRRTAQHEPMVRLPQSPRKIEAGFEFVEEECEQAADQKAQSPSPGRGCG